MTATQPHRHDSRRRRTLSNSRSRLEVVALFAAIALLHVVGFGTLLLIVAPHHYRVGEQVVGFGLGTPRDIGHAADVGTWI